MSDDYSPMALVNIALVCAVRLVQKGKPDAAGVELPLDGDPAFLKTFRGAVEDIMKTLTTATPHGMLSAEDLEIMVEDAKQRLLEEGFGMEEERLH